MRPGTWLLVGLGAVVWAGTGPAWAGADPERAASTGRRPYEGVWANSVAACRDPDGADRMAIQAGTFQWYETQCRARRVMPEGRRAWTIGMACEGEGRRYRARPHLTLASPDRLVFDASPVGPTRHQAWLRCAGR